jgi:hypothetical protein
MRGMTNTTDPDTGARPHHDARRLALTWALTGALTGTHMGENMSGDVPGWHGDRPDAGVFDARDMKIANRASIRLKARAEGQPWPAMRNGARLPR